MVSMQPCDLTKPPECQALVDFAVHTFGRIDVHFNMQRWMAYFNWLEDILDEEWDRNRRSEVDLVFYLTRAAWPYLKASHGVVVNTASLNALIELQEPGISCTHHGQVWHHRHDPAVGDGRPRAWDSREFDFAWSD
jgi:NAD(P)-dependent dehydrogenase (short-subunit alcohol dehydrogenase family)